MTARADAAGIGLGIDRQRILTDCGGDRRCDRCELPVKLRRQIRKNSSEPAVARPSSEGDRELRRGRRVRPLSCSLHREPCMATSARPKRKVARRPTSAKPATQRGRKAPARWSAGVTRRSDALDLESGVFKKRSARQVALSLKKSAVASKRRKATPFRSAMSMLNFEINRGGKNLTPERRRVLTNAKAELRKVFHRSSA